MSRMTRIMTSAVRLRHFRFRIFKNFKCSVSVVRCTNWSNFHRRFTAPMMEAVMLSKTSVNIYQTWYSSLAYTSKSEQISQDPSIVRQIWLFAWRLSPCSSGTRTGNWGEATTTAQASGLILFDGYRETTSASLHIRPDSWFMILPY